MPRGAQTSRCRHVRLARAALGVRPARLVFGARLALGFGEFAAAMLAAASGAAFAEPLPDGGATAPEIAGVMKGQDFPVETTKDKDGNPLLRSSAQGYGFSVYFYGCKETRCDSIQFSAAFNSKDVKPEKIAEWNRTRRFGRAWLDDDAAPWVEMDVDLEHGATTEAVAADLERWVSVLTGFNSFVEQH
jgi:hypothetical protein